MPTAFSDDADFSGITTAEPLLISAVVHQADIDVDEQGTEAAAGDRRPDAAAALPVDVVDLTVDRPFLFALATSTPARSCSSAGSPTRRRNRQPAPSAGHFRLMSVATRASTAPDTTTCDISTMAIEVSSGCGMTESNPGCRVPARACPALRRAQP